MLVPVWDVLCNSVDVICSGSHYGILAASVDQHLMCLVDSYWMSWSTTYSGGFRNSERGVQPLKCEARPKIFGLPRPLSVTLEVQTEYLEATLGLVKCLEISKELIRECVTCLVVVAACHSCIIIWWTRAVMYKKIHYSPPKGGCICTPLTPPESATDIC